MGFINQSNYTNTDWEAVSKNPSAIKAKYGDWIWKHDAEQYAYENYGKALLHLVSGTPFQNTNVPVGLVYKPWTIDDLRAFDQEGKKIELQGDWS